MAACLAILCAIAGSAVGPFQAGNGPAFDLAIAARQDLAVTPARHVAVVAIDERSLAAPALADIPRPLMQPVLAETLDALLTAEAGTIALDLLLSFSGDRLVPGHDTSLLRALYRGRDRIVLGRSAGSLPARPFVAALGYGASDLGLLEVAPESDGVFRRMSAGEALGSDVVVPSLVSAALAKAGWEMDGDIILGPYSPPESIPVYALADLLDCAERAPERVASAFGGRMVFIGTWLAEEDRKPSAYRFYNPIGMSAAATPNSTEPCRMVRLAAAPATGGILAGVHMHAMAAEQAMSNQSLRPVAGTWVAVLCAMLGAAAALAGMLLAPWASIALGLAAVSATGIASSVLLSQFLWLPPAMPIAGVVAGLAVAFPLRFVLERVRRWKIDQAFRHYLAPEMVTRIAKDPNLLTLGGEVRDLTVLFCDMRGFTTFAERMKDRPEELVQVLNHLLTALTEPVLRHGGTVDKYMGDAVMAFWNAPLDCVDHTTSAIGAALEMVDAVNVLDRHYADQAKRLGLEPTRLAIGIGIHTGPAIVGNLGSRQRFDYTAVGDTVNLASRVEGLCKTYGVSLIATGAAVAAVPGLAALELDRVAVRGRLEPEQIFAVVGDVGFGETDAFAAKRACHRRFLEACRTGGPAEIRDAAVAAQGRIPELGEFYLTMADRACSKESVRRPPSGRV